jgi:hypothetical protein
MMMTKMTKRSGHRRSIILRPTGPPFTGRIAVLRHVATAISPSGTERPHPSLVSAVVSAGYATSFSDAP